jgi:hypothetical protein
VARSFVNLSGNVVHAHVEFMIAIHLSSVGLGRCPPLHASGQLVYNWNQAPPSQISL